MSVKAIRYADSVAVVNRPTCDLRAGPTTDSELVSQEIFGKQVRVKGARGDWVRCRLQDGSEGWVAGAGLQYSDAYRPTHHVIKRFASVRIRGHSSVVLPMGSLITVRRRVKSGLDLSLPDRRFGIIPEDCVRSVGHRKLSLGAFRKVMSEVMGCPYLWGGRSPFGFDCSGLVQFLFEMFGIMLPRDSKDQACCGRLIRGVGALLPLDLLFFGEAGSINHVGIHLGHLKMLHSSGYVRIESLDRESQIFRSDLRGKFRWARRVAHGQI